MKLVKRIAIGLIAAAVLLQVPFIYRRYSIGRLADKVAALQSTRTQAP